MCSLLLITTSAKAANFTNGSGTGIWNDAGNWNSGTVPGTTGGVDMDSTTVGRNFFAVGGTAASMIDI